MASAADIIVNLVAKTGQLTGPMNRATRSLRNFQRTTRSVSRAVGAFGGVLAALGAAGGGASLAAITKQAIDANDKLGKMATRLGVSADALRDLQIAGERSGQNIRQLNIGLQRMTRRVAEAAVGTGEAQEALKTLGLDAKQLATLTIDKQFHAVAAAMQNVSGRSEQIRLAFKLFDSEGVGLVNTLMELNDEGFKEAARLAREMNATLSDFDVARFEVAANEMQQLNDAVSGIKNTIASQVLPFVGLLSDAFISTAQSVNKSDSAVNSMGLTIAKLVGAVIGVSKSFVTLLAVVADVGLGVVELVLEPVEKVERVLRNIAGFGSRFRRSLQGLETEPVETFSDAAIDRINVVQDNLKKYILQFKGINKTQDDFVNSFKRAANEQRRQAVATQLQRELTQLASAEIEAGTKAVEATTAALKKQEDTRKRITSIIESQRTAEEKQTADLLLLTTDIAEREADRNRLIEQRAGLLANIADTAEVSFVFIVDSSAVTDALDAVPALREIDVMFNKRGEDIKTIIDAIPQSIDINADITIDAARLDALLAKQKEISATEVRINTLTATRTRLQEILNKAVGERALSLKQQETLTTQITAAENALAGAQRERVDLMGSLQASMSKLLTDTEDAGVALLSAFAAAPEKAAEFIALQLRIIQAEIEQNAVIQARDRLQQQINEKKQAELNAIIASTTTQDERLRASIQKVALEIVRLAEARQSLENANVASPEQQAELNTLIAREIELRETQKRLTADLIELNERNGTTLTEFGIQAARNLQTAWADYFKSMEGGFSGILKSFGNMLREMVAQLLARQVLLSFFGLFSGNKGFLGQFANAAIGGLTKRAFGGPLDRGQAALVGERGPELFIPSAPGTVVPSDRFGSKVVNVNYTINAQGANENSIVARIIPLLENTKEQTKAEVRKEMQRGRFT